MLENKTANKEDEGGKEIRERQANEVEENGTKSST